MIDNQLLKKLPEGEKGNKFIKIKIEIIVFLLSISLFLNELKKWITKSLDTYKKINKIRENPNNPVSANNWA